MNSSNPQNPPSNLSASEGAGPEFTPQWGETAPRGARTVFNRIIKEGANVPLFFGQTLVTGLRDLGYNDTTSAICEFVDNSIQWGASEIRVFFHKEGKRGQTRLSVLVLDDGNGMQPNVLRAATAFGGSMCYGNRSGIGRYGMGMKAAGLSMSPVVDIFSWQERGAYYNMTIDLDEICNDKSNVVNLPEPRLADLPIEIRHILTQAMSDPRPDAQSILTTDPNELQTRLGSHGTMVFMPDCDRLTFRTAKSLVEHATKEMARIYRRQLAKGLRIYINNRAIEPFDPTYWMENARHTKVEGLNEKRSRLVQRWEVPIAALEENEKDTHKVVVRLFMLPIEDWDRLPRKTLRNDLQVFSDHDVSFMRSDREVQVGSMKAICGKHRAIDSWWRLEVEFPAELDEAFGVAVNKQGVRPKDYVTEVIRKQIEEELRLVRQKVEQFWSQRVVTRRKNQLSEAERRATEADPLQSSLLPVVAAQTPEEIKALDDNLRTLAISYKREGETDEEAFERIKASKFLVAFRHDDDAAPFYRVDFTLGRVILTLNSAHAFFEKLYKPLSEVANRQAAAEMSGSTADDVGIDGEAATKCAEALATLELLLLSLGRTQAEMSVNDASGERRKVLTTLRQQWSLNLSTQLSQP